MNKAELLLQRFVDADLRQFTAEQHDLLNNCEDISTHPLILDRLEQQGVRCQERFGHLIPPPVSFTGKVPPRRPAQGIDNSQPHATPHDVK